MSAGVVVTTGAVVVVVVSGSFSVALNSRTMFNVNLPLPSYIDAISAVALIFMIESVITNSSLYSSTSSSNCSSLYVAVNVAEPLSYEITTSSSFSVNSPASASVIATA